MSRELTRAQKAEKSILKKYRKTLWRPFIGAIKRYRLIEQGDKIAVCISGGKDSMLLAKLLGLLHKISEVEFELVYLVMDPGYSGENLEKIKQNAKALEIPLTVFETNIFDVAYKTEHSPCYLCAKMRRGHLYSKAQQLGCNKIALGHHLNDVIETTVMGMFYGSQLQGMLPKLRSKNFEGMQLIRPLYCICERDIIAWSRYNGLEFLNCACRFTQKSDDEPQMSKRREVKALIEQLRKTNPNIELSIFNSIHSVCLDTMAGYKAKDEYHFYLDDY